jgi:natural product precursor
MKKLSLGKMEILPGEQLDRSQMATVFGGADNNGFWACSCSSGPESTVMITDNSYPADAMVECTVVVRCRRLSEPSLH